MAAKITVADPVRSIKFKKNPDDAKVTWVCLEIVTGGSPAAPKGLPKASQVTYTVILNEKQYRKLEADSKEVGLHVKGSKVFIQGEITLDLPITIVEGEIGVIAYQLKNVDAEKLKTAAAKEATETELAGADQNE
ncbi:hypothetical protein [Paenibacillus ehimensis]|uniref:hypothetical protein n=1 Tax=Paenibacillus ehimensis TaxID=79264 RepID=UPI000FD6C422|nr:hypothetical protein [Paenibacillus ehimensis]